MVIKAIIFDMDGTLADTEEYKYQATKEVVKKYSGKTLTRKVFTKYVGVDLREISARIQKEFGFTKDPIALGEERANRSAELRKQHGVKPITKNVEFLKSLDKTKYKIALATSSRFCSINEILPALGIEKLFDVIVSGREFPQSKPDPTIYLETAKKLGIPPEQCLVIEDTTAGVVAGAEAGMKVIAVPNEWTKQQDFSRATITTNDISKVDITQFE